MPAVLTCSAACQLQDSKLTETVEHQGHFKRALNRNLDTDLPLLATKPKGSCVDSLGTVRPSRCLTNVSLLMALQEPQHIKMQLMPTGDPNQVNRS